MNSSLVRSLHRASQRARILSFSTKTRNPKTPKPILDAATKSAWKRPSEIPFQSKVANSVSLIGYVHSPVQFQTSSDGSPWAATVISQGISVSNDGDDRESPESLPLWVPVIFEGDLAHIAASYLKRNDRVYVSGLLSSSLPQIEGSKVQASIQVMVNDFNFVEEGTQKQKFSDASNEWERETSNNSGFSSTDKELLWKDLIENSPQWWDNREAKENCTVSPKYPDFKHKESGQVLWLSGAPISIVKSLQGLEFSVPIHKPKEMKQSKDSEDPILASWEDLIERSTEWRDFRNSKVNGEVSAKHPDFKRKDNTSSALWLNSAPKWILPQLEGLEFDVSCPQIKKSDQAPNADELWTDLVENFGDWWDNRVNKFNVRAPDFKHKKTGAALWLSSLPDWVSSKLPPPKIPFTESDNIL